MTIIRLYNSALYRGNAPGEAKWIYAGGHPAGKQLWRVLSTGSVTKHWQRLSKRLWNLHPWRYSKAFWTWSWAAGSWWPCGSEEVPLLPHLGCDTEIEVLYEHQWVDSAVQLVPWGSCSQRKSVPQRDTAGDCVSLYCAPKVTTTSFRDIQCFQQCSYCRVVLQPYNAANPRVCCADCTVFGTQAH